MGLALVLQLVQLRDKLRYALRELQLQTRARDVAQEAILSAGRSISPFS